MKAEQGFHREHTVYIVRQNSLLYLQTILVHKASGSTISAKVHWRKLEANPILTPLQIDKDLKYSCYTLGN